MTGPVMVATDFSECSTAATRVAAEYARQFGTRLHIVHVVWPITDPAPRTALSRLAEEFGRIVPVVTAVESGVPTAEQIVRYANHHGIGLIVLGTHGRTGVSRALVGSVAERVVRTASCPVLTVPCRARPPAPAEPAATPEPARCLVCRQVSEDLICEPCRARIRGEALERRRQQERPGL
jgi:nucleotide-binding universal stress UspA family protein